MTQFELMTQRMMGEGATRRVKPKVEQDFVPSCDRPHEKQRVNVVVETDLRRDEHKGVTMNRHLTLVEPVSQDARRLFLRSQTFPVAARRR
jgi:hypothetical protein